MNKPIAFKLLYYICFLFSVFIWFSTSNLISEYGTVRTSANVILGIVNLVLVIIFTIKLTKNKLEKVNIMFPIIHLIFSIIVVIIALIINNKLIFPYIHYSYYLSFILFNYVLLNIYSVLLFDKNKK